MKDHKNIDWQTPDWSREKPRRFWDPSRKLLGAIRDFQKIQHKSDPITYLRKKYCKLRHRIWTIVTGAEIDLHCRIGGGLLIPHPNGVVIHPDAIIGANCLIFQQVTLAGIVELDYHVDIGAGAKLLGPLKVGHSARIGANAVVTHNVSSNQTVVGIPARPIAIKSSEPATNN
ncbi:serine O-acetyltransferase [Microbulbifer sp. YPW1]|uniref:serine O-acetyltransferase n=1 Tax=Microbulbifer sp. YPW1 TaxID=2745199 RepID=UPI00159B296C|nr:serine acetyltransferase [Microbulbifer sp. YPW1]QKX16576.1 serine acetyltransferase [Microbulbifer sp. YPW1]